MKPLSCLLCRHPRAEHTTGRCEHGARPSVTPCRCKRFMLRNNDLQRVAIATLRDGLRYAGIGKVRTTTEVIAGTRIIRLKAHTTRWELLGSLDGIRLCQRILERAIGSDEMRLLITVSW